MFTSYQCSVCEFMYAEDTAERDYAGNPIPFEELDFEWTCPNCGVGQDLFDPIEENENAAKEE